MAEEKKKEEKKRPDEPTWGGETKDGDGGDAGVKVVGRNLYFYAGVNRGSILSFNEELAKLDVKMLTQAAQNDCDPLPIRLHIHSFGGSIFAGIAGMEAIRKCRVPVHTIVDGCAASAATFLSVVGDHRIMHEQSYMLIHQLSSVMWGKFQEFEDEMKNLKELMDMIKRTYLRHAKIPAKKLEAILKHDLWFSSRKCLRYGLVDEVI